MKMKWQGFASQTIMEDGFTISEATFLPPRQTRNKKLPGSHVRSRTPRKKKKKNDACSPLKNLFP